MWGRWDTSTFRSASSESAWPNRQMTNVELGLDVDVTPDRVNKMISKAIEAQEKQTKQPNDASISMVVAQVAANAKATSNALLATHRHHDDTGSNNAATAVAALPPAPWSLKKRGGKADTGGYRYLRKKLLLDRATSPALSLMSMNTHWAFHS